MPETTYVDTYEQYTERSYDASNRMVDAFPNRYESIGKMNGEAFRVLLTPLTKSVAIWSRQQDEWSVITELFRDRTTPRQPSAHEERDELLELAAFVVFGTTTL